MQMSSQPRPDSPPNKLLKLAAAPRRHLHRPPSRPWSRTTGSVTTC
jgi:hypothetical protein